MSDNSEAAGNKRSTSKSRRNKSQGRTNKMASKERSDQDAAIKAAVLRDERVRLLTQENLSLQKKLTRSQTQTDIVVQAVRDTLSTKKIVIDIPAAPKKSKKTTKREEIPVLCLGDWHIGCHIPGGAYEYNIDIAKKRIQLTVDKFLATVADRRTSAKIEELRLYLIGDMVEGEAMRQGHAHEIEAPVIKQAVQWAPECLAGAIVRLMGSFRKIKIVAVPGNHGRNGPPRGDAHPATNWDRVCYQTAKLLVGNAIAQQDSKRINDITWDLPADRTERTGGDDWFSIDYVFDWCNCLLHGEDITSGNSTFYGVERMVKQYADIVHDPIDFLFMGHIHTGATIPSNFREVFINGAVVSATRFARKQLVCATPPTQCAVFYTKDNGPISRHTFHLDERVPYGTRTLRALENRNRFGSRDK